ncbi:MAG: hypothetical protein CVV39_08605 [Planctomycetes bacterium HGW-Planctomycetes-1]|nr:MAG: hypothetical protein CVV39_08605 [Planctomycetes bacterium HGW-Planctomycetes-1]
MQAHFWQRLKWERGIATAGKGKERMRQSIRNMADSQLAISKMDDKEPAGRKLAKDKTDYYESLADKSDRFIDVDNEPPFLPDCSRMKNHCCGW